MKIKLYAAAVMSLAMPALADVTVAFDEGAPKDSFSIINNGNCPLGDADVIIDLGASAAGLIFDVTASGAGVSVFQPLEIVAGQEYLTSVPEVRDGDNRLVLPVDGLSPGARIAFTIDVDDTAGSTATMISGSEIEGARVSISAGLTVAEAVFSDQAVAEISYNGCSA